MSSSFFDWFRHRETPAEALTAVETIWRKNLPLPEKQTQACQHLDRFLRRHDAVQRLPQAQILLDLAVVKPQVQFRFFFTNAVLIPTFQRKELDPDQRVAWAEKIVNAVKPNESAAFEAVARLHTILEPQVSATLQKKVQSIFAEAQEEHVRALVLARKMNPAAMLCASRALGDKAMQAAMQHVRQLFARCSDVMAHDTPPDGAAPAASAPAPMPAAAPTPPAPVATRPPSVAQNKIETIARLLHRVYPEKLAQLAPTQPLLDQVFKTFADNLSESELTVLLDFFDHAAGLEYVQARNAGTEHLQKVRLTTHTQERALNAAELARRQSMP